MNETLVYFAMKYDGDFKRIFDAIKNKEPEDSQLKQYLLKKVKYPYVTINDPNYPEFLKVMNCPPIVLFYEGNLDLIKNDLPMKYEFLKNDRRFISTMSVDEKNGQIVFDYLVACESQKDLEVLADRLKNVNFSLKEYGNKKRKNREMER